MAYQVERIALRVTHAGTERSLIAHRFGQVGARPKVYMQAGLHASEVPGVVIAHHLLDRLRDADARGEIRGEVIIVPAANPIGLGDTVLGVHIGRYALASGANFNRGFLDLGAAIAPRLEGRLTEDATANVDLVREAMRAILGERQPKNEIDDLRLSLLRLAADADFVLDLHAEEDAIFAAVLAPWTLPHARELVADVGPALVFYADYPPLFDTACSCPWADLAKRFPNHAIPQACLSVTLELRGSGHVDDAQSIADAAGLFRFLQRSGAVAGDAGPLPELCSEPTRFEGVEFIRAAVPGIVVYKFALGATIAKGDVIAEIVQPFAQAPDQTRVPVISGTSGVFFACRHAVVVQADDVVAKVAGPEVLADPKHY